MPELTLTPMRNVATRQLAAAHAARKTAGIATRFTRRAVRTSSRAAWTGAETWTTLRLGMRNRMRRPAPRRTRVPEVAAAALAGIGVEYLLDPAGGKRRRSVLRDRALATGRRLARHGARRARYLEGKAEGSVREAASTPRPPTDDRMLADRVRTEICRRPEAPKGAVNVGVVDRVVFLRGEVPEQAEIERLIADARAVAGVRKVENFMHTPGSPAPQGGAA